MPALLTYTQQPWTGTYSEIIDVRSPSEFAEDRIPGAINLPVLNDAERAEVGTIYKQVSPFTARKLGAALVSKNISQHLSQHFAAKDKDYYPLIYCWRGGQRSNSMALVLTQIGWRVTLLEGGYKTYRAYVQQQLESLPEQFTYQVLCGLTGSGKTYILDKMRQYGAQVLNLENLANHRGSLLGEEWQGKLSPQPSQKYFETLLLEQLEKFNFNQPVWVESESQKIGQVYLPQSLWRKMKQGNCIEIQLPIAARVQFLLKSYPHLVNHPDILKNKLNKLKSRCGGEKLSQWYKLIDAGKWNLFVQDILQFHYDPIYSQSMKRFFLEAEKVLSISDLLDSTIDNLIKSLLLNNLAVH
ncbi:tRNA 2-selenouridine(34) synthase MnmH [Dendronalium sp. ChiSLP03b]|uniref:tRNA 2-selenouridine(34) synthase MnmH n=1 Tax=Dendronalium sp. ChiSLP03b TaxID=3075381 RepID=UPI002AD23A91|nr:tRNA 2-selenouridine(34) synthase MnmH [Dendronalium sp. ChiSLP03b]MDZ8207159.1 tRNA 2-selenouridine(34) synthase MnmH [Dendronalium sp. ChiSLP03b]